MYFMFFRKPIKLNFLISNYPKIKLAFILNYPSLVYSKSLTFKNKKRKTQEITITNKLGFW